MNRVSWDIQQCPLAMRCRARWERLEKVQGDPAIRFCATCERAVYLCRTDEDFARNSALGRCVALEVPNFGVAHIGEPPSVQTGYGVPESGNQDADP
jgi:hypothetical protein